MGTPIIKNKAFKKTKNYAAKNQKI